MKGQEGANVVSYESPWEDSGVILDAWKQCLSSYYLPESGGFLEALPPQPPALAYNWGFGAMLQAYAAVLAIEPIRRAALNDLPAMQKALQGYYLPRRHAFSSTTRLKGWFRGEVYYDDNAWIALASLDLYAVTHDPYWHSLAREIFHFLMEEGYDAPSGAVFWRERPKSSLHVCSTGPAALLGARLKEIGDGIELGLLDQMLDWCWSMRNDQGLFQDHQDRATGRIDGAVYTYNTGTPLQALAVLAEISDVDLYKRRAREVLRCVPQLLGPGGLPRTPWFNAVLLRALKAAHVPFSDPVVRQYQQDVEQLWHTPGVSGAPRVLPSRDGGGGALLRDAAATVEILALLAQMSSTEGAMP